MTFKLDVKETPETMSRVLSKYKSAHHFRTGHLNTGAWMNQLATDEWNYYATNGELIFPANGESLFQELHFDAT